MTALVPPGLVSDSDNKKKHVGVSDLYFLKHANGFYITCRFPIFLKLLMVFDDLYNEI